jgi:hypothetical protein
MRLIESTFTPCSFTKSLLIKILSNGPERELNKMNKPILNSV